MTKKILIDAFYNQLGSLLKQLTEMYPEDADFPMFVTTINLIKLTNPMLVVNIIKEEVADKYKEEIKAKDEKFFMECDYSADVDINIIHKLKQYVSGMPPSSKEAIWKYIDLISQLAVKIVQS